MTSRVWIIAGGILALTAVVFAAACASTPMRVATGFMANVACSQTFISGLDTDQVIADTSMAMPGVGLIDWGLNVRIDQDRKEVETSFLGFARTRAVYRTGRGCTLVHDDEKAIPPVVLPEPYRGPVLLPDIAGQDIVRAQDARLVAALEGAFAEPPQPPFRRTRAVVILKDGRIIAERYAPGIGVDTPIAGFSATKSVTNALIGILVRQGKLSLDTPAPVAAWADLADPRHAITVDHLLRHTSGLAMGSSMNASLWSAFDPVNEMKFGQRDMAAFAEAARVETTPGTAWNYHDGNYLILSRLIRDAAGGRAQDVLQLAENELFGPLGMRNVTIEFDATGTPEVSTEMFAPARDWARFGQLYLQDGVLAGTRILPEGWIPRTIRATPSAWMGMGAGFWTNQGENEGTRIRLGFGMPKDAFFARGMFGQYVIVVPSERLVVVRLGVTGGPRQDMEGVIRLINDVIAATRAGAGS
ncbi:MAG: serine hydrolase [Alphaproteobacteria bacterium]|nr:serine hydrolase [Alphaproteobacteria bacterium]